MKPAANAAFVRHEQFPWEEVGPGVRRKVLGHGPDLMMVRVEFAQGGVGTVHHHPHRQVTYVAAGSFEARVGDATAVIGPGDCFYVAAEAEHGVVCLEAGTLIDVFTPARADFLPPPSSTT